MSTTQAIDYDALAKQAGAISSQPVPTPVNPNAPASGGVDYDALARQAGAISSQPAQSATQPNQPHDALDDIEAGENDFEDQVTNVVGHPIKTAKNLAVGIWHQLPPVELYDQTKQALPVINAYEKARSTGATVGDAIKAADAQARSQNGVGQRIQEAVAAFKANPTRESVKTMLDAAVLAASTLIGGEAVAPEVAGGEASLEDLEAANAAKAAQAAPKPGLVQNVLKGEQVAQAPAKQALRSGANAAAQDAGVATKVAPAAETQPIRSLMDKPIAELAKTERATYDAINKAAGTDLKDLYDYRSELQDALDDPTNVANRTSLQKEMKVTQGQIDKAEASAAKNGVKPDALTHAKAMTQQRYAMMDLKKKLFDNESVVSGNLEHGVTEDINVKSAIRQLENLDKPSKFAPEGTPTRLQQALGEDGARALKQSLYDAQNAGQSALTKQKWATYLGTGIGGGTAIELLSKIFGGR
jgi:hypothetical protein